MNKDKQTLLIRYLFWTAALIVMLVIFIHSSQTAEESTTTSGSVAEKILAVVVPGFTSLGESEKMTLVDNSQHIIRKSAHFGVYLLLASCCFYALNTYNISKAKKLYTAFLIAAIYAVSDEIHQIFVPGRAGMFLDVLIDSTGAIVGIGISFLILKLLKRRQ